MSAREGEILAQPAFGTELDGLKLAIVGAGPAGLTVARAALSHGAIVEVFEQAGDPRGVDPGYTDRSFNFTLDMVGRAVLGDPRAWDGSIDVVGRAVHNFEGSGLPQYAPYQGGPEARSTSLPRPVLRRNLVSLIEEGGASLNFNTQVSKVEPDHGTVVMSDGRNTSADLVIVADGLHSVADSVLLDRAEVINEQLGYVTATLDSELNHGLSPHHLHFWHEKGVEAYAIGIPNLDGSVSVLFISSFADIDSDALPFATPDEAEIRLVRDFPQLLRLDPELPNQVQGRPRGRFYYKSTEQLILGKKSVVVGDAGFAAPPWVGWGANSALHAADTLTRFMVASNGDIETSLPQFQTHQLTLVSLMQAYIRDHGNFLKDRVAKRPNERSKPALAGLVLKACEVSGLPLPTIDSSK